MMTAAKIAVRVAGDVTLEEAHKASEGAHFLILPLAVTSSGRRTQGTRMLDGWLSFANSINSVDVIPLLEHAGPMAGQWSAERPLGAAETREVTSGRTSLAATSADWLEVTEAFCQAAKALGDYKSILVSVDDDGLLMGALSPRTNPSTTEEMRLTRVCDVVKAVVQQHNRVGVALCIDELCPRGIDLTEGANAALAMLDAGASTLLMTTGTAGLPSLGQRPRAQTSVSVWSSSARLVRGHLDLRSENNSTSEGSEGRVWIQAPLRGGVGVDGVDESEWKDTLLRGFATIVVVSQGQQTQ